MANLQPKFNRPQEEVNLIYEDTQKDYRTICTGFDPKWFAKGTKLVMYHQEGSGTVLNAISNLPEEMYQERLNKARTNRAK